MKNRILITLIAFVLLLPILSACGEEKKEESNPRGADDDDNGLPDDDSGDDHWEDDTGDDDSDDDGDDDSDDSDDSDDDLSYPTDPSDTGPFDVGQKTMNFPDPATGLNKEVYVFYPSSDDGESIDLSEGIRPVVLFGPAVSLEKELYMSYGRHLASWGFVVASRNNYSTAHTKLALTVSGIVDWLLDENTTEGGFFFQTLDASRIGASGHGLGGKISLLAATDDDRLRAFAEIDPVDSAPEFAIPASDYPSVTPELMFLIPHRTLFIGMGAGSDCAPAEENYQEYYEYADEPSVEITVLSAGHISVLDNPYCGAPCSACEIGTANLELVKELTRRYLTAYYCVMLHNMTEYERWLTGAGIAGDVSAGYVTTRNK